MPRSSKDTASTTEHDEPRKGWGWGAGLFRMFPVRSVCPKTQPLYTGASILVILTALKCRGHLHVLLTATRDC